MASFAQHEAEQISKRTRAALAQKKARGFQLGKPENLTDDARSRGSEIRIQNAVQNLANRQAGEFIPLYRQKNLTFREITDKLNANGYRTRRGKLFFPMSVARLLKRFDAQQQK